MYPNLGIPVSSLAALGESYRHKNVALVESHPSEGTVFLQVP